MNLTPVLATSDSNVGDAQRSLASGFARPCAGMMSESGSRIALFDIKLLCNMCSKLILLNIITYIIYVYFYEYRTKLGMTKVVLREWWGCHCCKTDRGPP